MTSLPQNRDTTKRDDGLRERLPFDAKEGQKLLKIDTIASLYIKEEIGPILASLWQSGWKSAMVGSGIMNFE
jgi:hypothetical protein